jgi:hypothetical protein
VPALGMGRVEFVGEVVDFAKNGSLNCRRHASVKWT